MPARSPHPPSGGLRNRKPQRPIVISQTLPFTCGPAALLSVLGSLGAVAHPTGGHLAEIDLWRETTAVACPGSHPLGLALAAERRGLRARLVWEGSRPWLWSHIRSQHALLRKGDYQRIEAAWIDEGRRLGVLDEPGPVPCEGAGLLLMEVKGPKGSHRSDPHWVGRWEGSQGTYLLNPLGRAPEPGIRSPEELWSRSGFEGTRCWISLEPRRRARGDPGLERRPRTADLNRPTGEPRKRFGRSSLPEA